jgi:exodeoxyribonuclease VII large subunit
MPEVHYTVTELMSTAAGAIDEALGGPVWVDGEISGARESRGHYYFDLVDRDDDGAVTAKVSIALWRGNRPRVEEKLRAAGSIRLDDGVRVRIRGPLELWLPGGRLQLAMRDIDPSFTLEALESERDRVLALLRAEGLLERNRRCIVPVMPTRIALVTADESAAKADFLHSLTESGLPWDVVFIDSRVQGAGAEVTIAAALRTADRSGVDVIALVRGGGSRLDLAVFDHELVARSIAAMRTPVFTGIGHEIDTSVADVVAHTASKTPTACAEALVEIAMDVVRRSEEAWTGIAEIVTHVLDAERARLSSHARRAALGARSRLTVEQHRMGSFVERIERSTSSGLRAAAARLDVLGARTDAVDPIRTLARGWSITRTAAGTVVRRAGDVAVGDELVTTLAEGSVTTTVTATND